MAEEDGPRSDRPSATTSQAAPTASFASVNAQPPNRTPKPARIASKSPPTNQSRTPDISVKPTPLESQPMTATTSTSSLPPDQSGNNGTDAKDASPYGTRSRNRNGSSRPNYAEEPEVMEYEWTSAKKSQAPSEPAGPASDLERTSGANTRRSSNTAPTAPTPPTAAPKTTMGHISNHQMPGMSSFAVNPSLTAASAPPTRKRKAPGSAPVIPQNASVLTQTSTTGSPRRQGPATASQTTRTTSLMTFEGCQGYLKNGKLKADDGTWIAVGGKSLIAQEPHAFACASFLIFGFH